MQHIMFYPDHTKRKTGCDKLGWNCAFNNALLAFRDYKLSKYTNNISPRLDDGHWTITKSGDAQGEFNSITRMLRCSSESNCYFGITHDLDISQHIGKTLLLSLHISKIQSVRDDVGYFPIWENRINEPKKTVSTFLLNLNRDKEYYHILYDVPSDLARLRVVIQAKNGEFQVDNLDIRESIVH